MAQTLHRGYRGSPPGPAPLVGAGSARRRRTCVRGPTRAGGTPDAHASSAEHGPSPGLAAEPMARPQTPGPLCAPRHLSDARTCWVVWQSAVRGVTPHCRNGKRPTSNEQANPGHSGLTVRCREELLTTPPPANPEISGPPVAPHAGFAGQNTRSTRLLPACRPCPCAPAPIPSHNGRLHTTR